MWSGVGHLNRLGGGERNVFGLDFKANGFQWNDEICRADSDGDGWTNGYELGDPDCTWSPGQTPSRSDNITHPGICDPYNSPECLEKNSFVDCDVEKSFCPRINNPGVLRLNMTFPEIQIPSEENTYYCMTFDLPSDQDYHILANEPIVDNMEVFHHTLVWACEEENPIKLSEPRPCGEETRDSCTSMVGFWTTGYPGVCFDDDAGFRFGKTGFKRVKLEVHYHNALKRPGMTDGSGISLYYQPVTPEIQDMLTFIVGEQLIEIPPGKPRFELNSVCKESCTKKIVTKPAKIFAGLNVMQVMGSSMTIQLLRDGRIVKNITYEKSFRPTNPKLLTHTPTLDLLPGDEIKTTCVYNSFRSNRSVFFGETTGGEMCYGFVFVYPKEAFSLPNCLTFDALDICDLTDGNPLQTPKGECNWGAFTYFDDNYQPPWTDMIQTNCQMDGRCRPECKWAVEKLMEDPCMDKVASSVINWRLADSDKGRSALARMNGCRGAIYHSDGDSKGGQASCGWEECSMYCGSGSGSGSGGPYDGAPNMAAGSITVFTPLLVLLYLSI
ncbi:dopamine beta-hydroxylase [Plakobranchus ocellatus]|uniref:Dopamine beta-hydroxylase n=1 Tax=Plakobranchus ocellatus TaxID=259542 RepID=A0AAV3YB38_9GAST|nr:dopamine beta-hydroxylase [Plakobranchus ocellatus]